MSSWKPFHFLHPLIPHYQPSVPDVISDIPLREYLDKIRTDVPTIIATCYLARDVPYRTDRLTVTAHYSAFCYPVIRH